MLVWQGTLIYRFHLLSNMAADQETLQGKKSLAAYLRESLTPSTREMYRRCVLRFMRVALGKAEGSAWEDPSLTSEYLARLEGSPDPRRRATDDLQLHADWMLKEGYQYETCAWHFRQAKAWVEYLMEDEVQGWAARNVRRTLVAVRVPRKVRVGLTQQRLHDVAAWMSPEARAFAMVLKSSGARPEEVAGLQSYDVNANADPWQLVLRGVKEGGDRTTFVDRETQPHLRRVMDSQDYSADSRVFKGLGKDRRAVLGAVRREWRRSLKRIGLDQRGDDGRLVYRLYLTRSYFRTRLGAAGQRELAELLLGHHTEATEEAYSRYTVDDLSEIYRSAEDALRCAEHWERDQEEAAAKAREGIPP
jgi:site-specific recombinase XerC